MTDFNIELWLILQLLIETGLCVLIMYYIYGAKNLRKAIILEKEKMKTAVDSLHHLIKKSEELDRKRQKVLELWAKLEGKGAVLENRIDRYENKCKNFPKPPGDKRGFEEIDSSAHSYEKVSSLIEKGLSANEISQRLGLPRGEVELVMNLKRQ